MSTTQVSSAAFQAFACDEFDNGKSFLRADFAVECYTPEHDSVRGLAILGILLCDETPFEPGTHRSAHWLIPLSPLPKTRWAYRCSTLSSSSKRNGPSLTSSQRRSAGRWGSSLSTLRRAGSRGSCSRPGRSACQQLNLTQRPAIWTTHHLGCLLLRRLFLVGFCVLIFPGTILQLLIAFIFSLLCMLLTAVTSPFASDVDDTIGKAFGFSLSAIFFFAVVIKVNVLTESVDEYLSPQLRKNFVFNSIVISALMSTTIAIALVVTTLVALKQFMHAAQTPVIKLRSSHSRPALPVAHGITWHLFLSQCAHATRTPWPAALLK